MSRKKPGVVPTPARVSHAVPECPKKRCPGPMVRIGEGWTCRACTKVPVGKGLNQKNVPFAEVLPNRESRRAHMERAA